MNKSALIAIIVVAAIALVAMGVYIGRKGGSQSGTQVTGGSVSVAADDYESKTEMPVTDPIFRQVDPALKAVLQEVFGGGKATGYFAGFMGTQSGAGSSVEYTIKRRSNVNDLSPLIAAFARLGYVTQFSGQQGNAASFMVRNGSYLVTASYEMESLKVTVMAAQAQAAE